MNVCILHALCRFWSVLGTKKTHIKLHLHQLAAAMARKKAHNIFVHNFFFPIHMRICDEHKKVFVPRYDIHSVLRPVKKPIR